jgi:4-hydroxy-3-polyprenylbenzoate decarboxylase
VLLLRETPLHAGHIQLMATATASGAVVFPPVPAFYHHPLTVQDIVDHTIGRVLDLFDIEAGLSPRWSGRLHRDRAETGLDTAPTGLYPPRSRPTG